MKKTKIFAGIISLGLLLGITGCNKTTDNVTTNALEGFDDFDKFDKKNNFVRFDKFKKFTVFDISNGMKGFDYPEDTEDLQGFYMYGIESISPKAKYDIPDYMRGFSVYNVTKDRYYIGENSNAQYIYENTVGDVDTFCTKYLNPGDEYRITISFDPYRDLGDFLPSSGGYGYFERYYETYNVIAPAGCVGERIVIPYFNRNGMNTLPSYVGNKKSYTRACSFVSTDGNDSFVFVEDIKNASFGDSIILGFDDADLLRPNTNYDVEVVYSELGKFDLTDPDANLLYEDIRYSVNSFSYLSKSDAYGCICIPENKLPDAFGHTGPYIRKIEIYKYNPYTNTKNAKVTNFYAEDMFDKEGVVSPSKYLWGTQNLNSNTNYLAEVSYYDADTDSLLFVKEYPFATGNNQKGVPYCSAYSWTSIPLSVNSEKQELSFRLPENKIDSSGFYIYYSSREKNTRRSVRMQDESVLYYPDSGCLSVTLYISDSSDTELFTYKQSFDSPNNYNDLSNRVIKLSKEEWDKYCVPGNKLSTKPVYYKVEEGNNQHIYIYCNIFASRTLNF